jgi:hypothetical protein
MVLWPGGNRALYLLQLDRNRQGRRRGMDESKRRAIQFLEKEIKTYTALALFLSKEGIKHRVRLKNSIVLLSPAFYKERIKEAKKLVNDLKKPN